MADEDYRYEALNLDKQQIRLISLKPALSNEDHVECDLQVFDVEPAPKYVCLSYTWGPSTPTRTILVDGKRFEVRKNLFDFLTRYRNNFSNSHYLWIDQICISQAHTGERNHQVAMMSDIYSKCLYSISWLGSDPKHEATVLRFFNRPSRMTAREVFENPYFSRLWIVQEVLLPPEVRVLCGRAGVTWDNLLNQPRNKTSISGPRISNQLSRFTRFRDASRTGIHTGKKMALLDCLALFPDQQCEDPRDKIYGLLGLVDKSQRPKVDYEKSVHEVVLDTLRQSILSFWCAFDYSFLMIPLPRLLRQIGLIENELSFDQALEDMEYICNLKRKTVDVQNERNTPIKTIGFSDGTSAKESIGGMSISKRDGVWFTYDGDQIAISDVRQHLRRAGLTRQVSLIDGQDGTGPTYLVQYIVTMDIPDTSV